MTGDRERDLLDANRAGPTTSIRTLKPTRSEIIRSLETLFEAHERVLGSWPDRCGGYGNIILKGDGVAVGPGTRIAVLRVADAGSAWELRELLGDSKRFFMTETSSIPGREAVMRPEV